MRKSSFRRYITFSLLFLFLMLLPVVSLGATPMVAAGHFHTVGLNSNGTVVATGHIYYNICNVSGWTDIVQVAAGDYHTLGLKNDGTMVATGYGSSDRGQCDVGGWADIIQVAAGQYHTLGLKNDGTVVATGYDNYGQCDVSSWTDIVQVATGGSHTLGLKNDGTVVATGYDNYGQCDVSGWTDIVQVAAGQFHTLALKNDGTVVATGYDGSGQCNVSGWTDIVQIAAGGGHTVGVKSDGTVIATGRNDYSQCAVSCWTDIVQIVSGDNHTVGIKINGTMVAVGNEHVHQCDVSDWTDIIQAAAGLYHTVGVKSDGTVVATSVYGNFDRGQCDVIGWTDIVQVAVVQSYTVGLRSDGTVVATGYDGSGQRDVSGWTDIVQVAAGQFHTLGLKNDGTVVATGYDGSGQCNVSGWTDIVQIAAGGGYTLGLKNDGTVVATGYDNYGQCGVSSWTDIVQVAAGQYHTLGLKNDGTAVATGYDNYGQCNVSGWTDIVQVAAGQFHTLGLKNDGLVVAKGSNAYCQCNVNGWHLIVGALSGVVTDSSTGMPLTGTNIFAGSSTTTSGADGSYLLSLSPGTYDVVYGRSGYQAITISAVVANVWETTELNVYLNPPGFLNITSTSHPPASIGIAYDSRVMISGGVWPFTFSIAYGTLPPGLSLDSDFGTISGTPTTASSYTFAVAVQDSQGTYAEREFTIEVTEVLEIITDDCLPRATLGDTYFCSVEATGGTQDYWYDIVSGHFPDGIAMSMSGNIGGTEFVEKFDSSSFSADWSIGGTVNPFITSDNKLEFGNIGGDGSSYAQVTLETNNQSSVKFDWRVSSCGADWLRFFIDGSEKVKWNYVHHGTYVYDNISHGVHTFRWEYNKDRFGSCNADTAWIDNIYIDDPPSVPTEVGNFQITVEVTDASGRTTEKAFSLAVDEPLSFTTSRLNDGVVIHPYNQTLIASGGYGAYSWQVFNGTLPSGLLLNETTGVISGSPIEATNRSIVMAVSDEAGRITYQDFSLHISSVLAISTSVLPTALINTPFSEAIRTNGGIAPYNFTYEGQLPAGLGLNASSGIISGTPTLAGYTNVGVTVSDSSWPTPQETTQVLGIRVSSMLTILTTAVIPNSKISVTMNPVVLTAGGGPSPFGWTVVGGNLPAGIVLDPETGQLSGTPLEHGDFAFTIQVTDSNAATSLKEFFWHVSATLLIDTSIIFDGAQNEFYNTTLAAHGGLKPYFWRIISGTLPSGLSFNNGTGTISGTPTTRQAYSFTVEVSDNDSPAQTFSRTYDIEIFDNLYIRTPSLPNGRDDDAYTATIEARQGVPPYIWQLESGSLPPGVSLTSTATTASINGTPTIPGVYTFTLKVRDSGDPENQAIKEFIVEIYGDIVITTEGLHSALRGQPYSDTVSVGGGVAPYHWQLLSGSLPTGLSLNPTTGAITGTTYLDEGTSSTFTVRITDDGEPSQYVDQEFTIQVISPLAITATMLEAHYGEPYEFTLTGEGGISPLTWFLTGGNLPDGLIFDPETGIIAGTPTTCGDYGLTIRLTDSSPVPEMVEEVLWLTVDCSELPITEDFEVGSNSGLSWYSSGDGFWTFSNSKPYNDLRAATSPSLSDSQTSSLSTSVLCDEGPITFWYAVDSDAGWDFLKFYVDGELIEEWSGNIPYSLFTSSLVAGRHTLTWQYVKNESASAGADMAWIDDIFLPLHPKMDNIIDFDSDKSHDIALFSPANGKWYTRNQADCIYATADCIPIPGDYNGDAKTDLAIVDCSRPDGLAKWYIRDQTVFIYGRADWIPVPGDYDGDGITDFALFDPATGKWYVRGKFITTYGQGGIPVPGDYDGDGDTDIAVFYPATNKWYIKDLATYTYGIADCIPVPADYDGDGATDLAVIDISRSDGRSKWYIRNQAVFIYGSVTDTIPIPGDYDGDGDADPCLFYQNFGKWYCRNVGIWTYGNGDMIPLSGNLATRYAISQAGGGSAVW